MPRPRGADAAGLLLRELELHPPAEEWHRRNMFGGPWSDPEDLDDTPKLSGSSNLFEVNTAEDLDSYYGSQGLWPRKRRLSERDAAFGLKTSVGLGAYLGIMGSRRDVVTAVWKTGLRGIWYKVSTQKTTTYTSSSFCSLLELLFLLQFEYKNSRQRESGRLFLYCTSNVYFHLENLYISLNCII